MADPSATPHGDSRPSTLVQRTIVHPCAVIFVTLELESSSKIARVFSILFMVVTLLSIFATVVGSEPSLMRTPLTCADPACDNNPKWCPGYMICPPEPSPVFETIENICIYLFSIEYGLKFITCWSVSPQAAGILPQDDTVRSLHNAEEPTKEYGRIEQTLRWARKFKNVVDLACWLPFYIDMLFHGSQQGSTVVRTFRLLRVIRVFRLLNMLHMFEQVGWWPSPLPAGTLPFPFARARTPFFLHSLFLSLPLSPTLCLYASLLFLSFSPSLLPRYPSPSPNPVHCRFLFPPRFHFTQMYVMTQLLVETLQVAWAVLAVFVFFSLLITVLFGSIMFFFEAGTYTISADYPEGAYLRLAANRKTTEVSPFLSVGAAFYWVIVTGATGTSSHFESFRVILSHLLSCYCMSPSAGHCRHFSLQSPTHPLTHPTNCTVGYGDLVPTTHFGRALASLTCIVGILGVAAPVGVLGSSFKRIYDRHFHELRGRICKKKKHLIEQAQSGQLARRESASPKGGSVRAGGSMVKMYNRVSSKMSGKVQYSQCIQAEFRILSGRGLS